MNMTKYRNTHLGEGCKIFEGVTLGVPSREYLQRPEEDWPPTKIGDGAVIRRGTIIYCDVSIGGHFQTGHNVLVREKTRIGDRVLVGTGTIIDGETRIGNNVSIQSMVYIPLNTKIEDKVFIGPNAVLTNDRYPMRIKETLKGPTIRRGASIGANSTILPEVEVGEGAMVAAGAVVTKDVPPWKLAVGCPAVVKDLPEKLKKMNQIGD
jgi:acetyltransferase-like isoleucine patch superfamily enzyme